MQTTLGHLGGKRDEADERDRPYEPKITNPPPTGDLCALVASVYNQLPMQYTCSANALAAAFEIVAKIEKRTIDPPSRLFFYWNARVRENAETKDDGVALRNAIKAAAKPGTCPEPLWPYDQTKVCVKPSDAAFAGANESIDTYFRIDQNIDHMKSCIAEGFPFIFGMALYVDKFVASQTSGVYALPDAGETSPGGHAVVAIGYDQSSFTVLNSAGSAWGKNGYITMPYAWFQNPDLTYDFWTIRSLK
jgi:C1A family cysteine protease